MFKVIDHRAILQSGSGNMEEMHRMDGYVIKNRKKRKCCSCGLVFAVLGVWGLSQKTYPYIESRLFLWWDGYTIISCNIYPI